MAQVYIQEDKICSICRGKGEDRDDITGPLVCGFCHGTGKKCLTIGVKRGDAVSIEPEQPHRLYKICTAEELKHAETAFAQNGDDSQMIAAASKIVTSRNSPLHHQAETFLREYAGVR